MLLINGPVRRASKNRIALRIHESLLHKLHRSAEFIKAKNEYVIIAQVLHYSSITTSKALRSQVQVPCSDSPVLGTTLGTTTLMPFR